MFSERSRGALLRISHVVQVTGPIGCKGWSAVAGEIQSHPALKEAMDEASREDLRKFWDAQHGIWDVKH